jgi:hypothetical protein
MIVVLVCSGDLRLVYARLRLGNVRVYVGMRVVESQLEMLTRLVSLVMHGIWAGDVWG